jgi:Putative Ig domain
MTCSGRILAQAFLLCSCMTTVSGQAPSYAGLPYARPGQSYSVQLTTTVAGRAPFMFELRNGSGELPKGLSLNSATGVLSGVPDAGNQTEQASGTTLHRAKPAVTGSAPGMRAYRFMVDVTDASGKLMQSLPLELVVSASPQPVTVGATMSDPQNAASPGGSGANASDARSSGNGTSKDFNETSGSSDSSRSQDQSQEQNVQNESGNNKPTSSTIGEPKLPQWLTENTTLFTVISDPTPSTKSASPTAPPPLGNGGQTKASSNAPSAPQTSAAPKTPPGPAPAASAKTSTASPNDQSSTPTANTSSKDTLQILVLTGKTCDPKSGTPLVLSQGGQQVTSVDVGNSGITPITLETPKSLTKGSQICAYRTYTPASGTASTAVSSVVEVQGKFVQPKFVQDPVAGSTTISVMATPTDAKNTGTTDVELFQLPRENEKAAKSGGKTATAVSKASTQNAPASTTPTSSTAVSSAQTTVPPAPRKSNHQDEASESPDTKPNGNAGNVSGSASVPTTGTASGQGPGSSDSSNTSGKGVACDLSNGTPIELTGSKFTAATNSDGLATLTLAEPLPDGVRVCAYQTFTNLSGAEVEIPDELIASEEKHVFDNLNWGRVRAYFAGGILIANDQSSFSSSSASPFLLLNIEKTWLLPGCAVLKPLDIKPRDSKSSHGKSSDPKPQSASHASCENSGAGLFHPGVTSYFDTRLTAIPVQTNTTISSTSSSSSTNSGGDLSSQKTARLEVGIYAPWVLTHWYYDKKPNGLFFAPLAKVGFDTLTGSTSQTLVSGASPVNFNRFYNHWGFGARFGHYGLANSENKSPEVLSYFDVTLGPYTNLQSYVCVPGTSGPLPGSSCPSDDIDSRTALYRLDLEGMLKIPRTVMFVGFNANVKASSRKKLDLNLQPNDDLRFLFGAKLDVASVMQKLGVSNNNK